MYYCHAKKTCNKYKNERWAKQKSELPSRKFDASATAPFVLMVYSKQFISTTSNADGLHFVLRGCLFLFLKERKKNVLHLIVHPTVQWQKEHQFKMYVQEVWVPKADILLCLNFSGA